MKPFAATIAAAFAAALAARADAALSLGWQSIKPLPFSRSDHVRRAAALFFVQRAARASISSGI